MEIWRPDYMLTFAKPAHGANWELVCSHQFFIYLPLSSFCFLASYRPSIYSWIVLIRPVSCKYLTNSISNWLFTSRPLKSHFLPIHSYFSSLNLLQLKSNQTLFVTHNHAFCLHLHVVFICIWLMINNVDYCTDNFFSPVST